MFHLESRASLTIWVPFFSFRDNFIDCMPGYAAESLYYQVCVSYIVGPELELDRAVQEVQTPRPVS